MRAEGAVLPLRFLCGSLVHAEWRKSWGMSVGLYRNFTWSADPLCDFFYFGQRHKPKQERRGLRHSCHFVQPIAKVCFHWQFVDWLVTFPVIYSLGLNWVGELPSFAWFKLERVRVRAETEMIAGRVNCFDQSASVKVNGPKMAHWFIVFVSLAELNLVSKLQLGP